MFIQTQDTPNPNTLKFIPDGEEVLKDSVMEFKSQKEASTKSPLALQLFAATGVESVFFGKDFITITKKEDIDWEKIKAEVTATIMDFYVSGKKIIFEQKEAEK